MNKFQITAVDDEPRRVGVGLDDVAKLRMSIFEASRWVFLDGALQEVVELASGGFLLAPSIDIKGKIK